MLAPPPPAARYMLRAARGPAQSMAALSRCLLGRIVPASSSESPPHEPPQGEIEHLVWPTSCRCPQIAILWSLVLVQESSCDLSKAAYAISATPGRVGTASSSATAEPSKSRRLRSPTTRCSAPRRGSAGPGRLEPAGLVGRTATAGRPRASSGDRATTGCQSGASSRRRLPTSPSGSRRRLPTSCRAGSRRGLSTSPSAGSRRGLSTSRRAASRG